jgi:hypothetical protein
MIFCEEGRAHKSARKCYRNLGFEVLTAMVMKIYVPEDRLLQCYSTVAGKSL